MIVGTSEAAKILNISSARLRVLLLSGRVEGAYKTGKMWLIPFSWCAFPRSGNPTGVAPLFDGKPIIQIGKRGPAPRWRNPRKPTKTIIHVNTHKIKNNQKHHKSEPVITVKRGNTNQYGHEVEIPGGCRVVYRPDMSKFGARVWIESLYKVNVTSVLK